MSDFDHQPNGANMDDPEFVKPVQRPPPPKIPKAVSRTKEVVSQDLRMDDEVVLGQFQNVHTLSVSEARMIVNAVFQQRKEKGKHYKETENMTKMFDYLDMFSRFKQQENITAVEQVLSAHTELAFAERSQLGMLVLLPAII